MNEDEIDLAIANIMINDGPDGHCDGSEIITEFVLALLKGEGESWIENYMNTPRRSGLPKRRLVLGDTEEE